MYDGNGKIDYLYYGNVKVSNNCYGNMSMSDYSNGNLVRCIVFLCYSKNDDDQDVNVIA